MILILMPLCKLTTRLQHLFHWLQDNWKHLDALRDHSVDFSVVKKIITVLLFWSGVYTCNIVYTFLFSTLELWTGREQKGRKKCYLINVD